jgi:transposase-like protein
MSNVPDTMPNSVQGKAKRMPHEIQQVPKKQKARAAYEHFRGAWREKYPKAVESLPTEAIINVMIFTIDLSETR